MEHFPVFLSVVFPLRNQAGDLERILTDAAGIVASKVNDYEFIVVDNASEDESVAVLKRLSGENGLPNLQVYALTQEVDDDTAAWVGLENALGDFIAVVNPLVDDVAFLPQMLANAIGGADAVFARNELKVAQSVFYRGARAVFNLLYRWFGGVHLAKDAPRYRVLSKRVVNFILQHPQPAITYRHLPASGGFARVNLSYSAPPGIDQKKKLFDSIDRGMRLLVSTTRAPMRLVTTLSLFGAIANLCYSAYVVGVAILKTDVAPGWISLSLQQSGMFFLISLVLLVLGEYILHMASFSNEGPLYHVGQEFTSARMTRKEKLNIEDAAISAADISHARKNRAA
ncbi:MAG: glycosyltransferase [Zoogloea sp.]|nr:glycosyltransferase [Zoogloea sp.]